MLFEPIGILESCYRDKFGTPRQPGLVEHSWARLKIFRSFQPEESLQGIEGFSHLWLIFVFHKNSNERFHAKVHPPRMEGESIGLFATRSPHRPNPIGLSLVKLVRREADSLILAGIDLVDGTPILDVKPYLPEVEAVTDARAGWAGSASKKNADVEWNESLLEKLALWEKSLAKDPFRLGEGELRKLIEETLILDPRPLVYRGFEGEGEAPYRKDHAVRFFDGDVHFEYLSSRKIRVNRVLWPLAKHA